jgi:ATP-binding cassette subfamily C protein CydD
LAARLSVGLREIEIGVQDGLLAGLRAALTLLPLGAALYIESSSLAWGAVLLLGAFGCAMSLARRHWKRWQAEATSVAEGMHRELDELVSHIDVWRTYGAGERVCHALERLGGESARAGGRADGARAALSSANEFLGAVALVATIAFARRLSIPLGDGTIVVFAALFFMSYRPLRDLGDARAAIDRGARALASLEALAPIDEKAHRVEKAPRGASRSRTAWRPAALRVERVGVEREGASFVTTSFTARPGEIVAIVGPTGSGKTTLLRALLGLEPTAAGRVLYGAEDLTARGVGPHERPFAWMPQDSPIIAGTLEDNVLSGDDGRANLRDVLASIGAESLLAGCGDAILGGAGRAVSGGERKWIALARAIATEVPVLLLDEPTAGLDRDAQAGVLGALAGLRGRRTVVIVSHEAHVVAIADRVVRVGVEEKIGHGHGHVYGGEVQN